MSDDEEAAWRRWEEHEAQLQERWPAARETAEAQDRASEFTQLLYVIDVVGHCMHNPHGDVTAYKCRRTLPPEHGDDDGYYCIEDDELDPHYRVRGVWGHPDAEDAFDGQRFVRWVSEAELYQAIDVYTDAYGEEQTGDFTMMEHTLEYCDNMVSSVGGTEGVPVAVAPQPWRRRRQVSV